MASASIEKSPGAIEISSVTPTTQYVPISTKKKANEDQLPKSNVPNMQSNSEVSVHTYGNLTSQPQTQQTNKNRYNRPQRIPLLVHFFCVEVGVKRETDATFNILNHPAIHINIMSPVLSYRTEASV
jgi:hypothetical protein